MVVFFRLERGNRVGNQETNPPPSRNRGLRDKPKLALKYLMHIFLIEFNQHILYIWFKLRKTNDLGSVVNFPPILYFYGFQLIEEPLGRNVRALYVARERDLTP